MKSDEFYLGVLVYALIIAAGFYRPTLEKLGNIAWDIPTYSVVQDHFHSPVPVSHQQVKKSLLALKVRQILTPDRGVSVSAIARDSIRQNLEEKWKKMASHPAGLGLETEYTGNAPPLLEIKTGSKTKTVPPEKKVSGVEEPIKG